MYSPKLGRLGARMLSGFAATASIAISQTISRDYLRALEIKTLSTGRAVWGRPSQPPERRQFTAVSGLSAPPTAIGFKSAPGSFRQGERLNAAIIL